MPRPARRSPSAVTAVSFTSRAYGRLDTAASLGAVDANTMYDMASLTKVVATTTAAMMLEEQGLLDLDRTVASYLPGIQRAGQSSDHNADGRSTHRGGLEALRRCTRHSRDESSISQQINPRPLKSVPGTQMVYSDWDMILTAARHRADHRHDARQIRRRKRFSAARNDEHDVHP